MRYQLIFGVANEHQAPTFAEALQGLVHGFPRAHQLKDDVHSLISGETSDRLRHGFLAGMNHRIRS